MSYTDRHFIYPFAFKKIFMLWLIISVVTKIWAIRINVSLFPINLKSMNIEVIHIAVDVNEKAIPVPVNIPEQSSGFSNSTSVPLQK